MSTRIAWTQSISILLVFVGCNRIQKEPQPEQIWNQVGPSVVRVEALAATGETTIGSGFACEVAGKKVIVSNRHVVLGAKEIRVGASENSLITVPGYRIGRELDLAIIEPPTTFKAPSLQRKTTSLSTGAKVYCIGYPLGLNKSITQGLVSSLTPQVVQFDAPISSGNSGGPLVDATGQLVGVVTAGATGTKDQIAQNLNFAIRSELLETPNAFIKPARSAFDAWVALIEFENKLLDDLHDSRALDLKDYLKDQVDMEVLKTTDEWKQILDFKPVGEQQLAAKRKVDVMLQRLQGKRNTKLGEIVKRHGNLERAVTATIAFLNKQAVAFDRVPDLFLGLGETALFEQWIKTNQEPGYDIWRVSPAEFAGFSKISCDYAKAAYEDAAYQIEFLARTLPRLQQGDAALSALLRNASHEARTNLHLPYCSLPKNAADAEGTRLYGLSLQRQLIGFREASPPIPRTALGFEDAVAGLFSDLARSELQQGDVTKAIAYMQNELTRRKQPYYRRIAELNILKGEFDRAYSLYERGFDASLDLLNPYALEDRGLHERRWLLWDLNDRPSIWVPASLQDHLNAWKSFLNAKQSFAMLSMPLEQVVGSDAFHKCSLFEKCCLLYGYELRHQKALEQSERAFKIPTSDRISTTPPEKDEPPRFFINALDPFPEVQQLYEDYIQQH